MGYNYGHRNLPKQTQEILRQQKKSEEATKKAEKERLDLIGLKIIELLKTEKEPLTVNEIATKLKYIDAEVLKCLNVLTKENKIKLVILEDKKFKINSPHYTL